MQSQILISLAFCGQDKSSPGISHLLPGTVPPLGVGSLPGADGGHRADGKCFSLKVTPNVSALCSAVRGLGSKRGSSAHYSHLF